MAQNKKKGYRAAGPKRLYLKGPALTIAGAEDALASIANHVGTDQVVLPTRGQGLSVGGEVALIQLLNSWKHRFGNLVLRTYATRDDEVLQIERLSRRLYGVAGALICNEALRFDDGSDITQKIVDQGKSQVEALWKSPASASRGLAFEILCADHFGKSSPDLLYKYDDKGKVGVRPLDEFPEISERILSSVLKGAYRKLVSNSSAEALSGMLWEIFRNTEDHGKVTLEGNRLPCSIRGLQARKHSLLPGHLAEIVEGFAPLSDYCARLRPRAGAQQIHLFELSVFDSGIGFAQSIRQKPLSSMSLNDEFEAVRHCFGSGSRKAVKGHGEGLPHVVRLLKEQKGFLRLRTGRLSLFANFDDATPAGGGGDLQLNEWTPSRTILPEAKGSAITVLLPLEIEP